MLSLSSMQALDTKVVKDETMKQLDARRFRANLISESLDGCKLLEANEMQYLEWMSMKRMTGRVFGSRTPLPRKNAASTWPAVPFGEYPQLEDFRCQANSPVANCPTLTLIQAFDTRQSQIVLFASFATLTKVLLRWDAWECSWYQSFQMQRHPMIITRMLKLG